MTRAHETAELKAIDSTPQPLGPDSLTWKYFGDWRGLLLGRVDAEHAPSARRRR